MKTKDICKLKGCIRHGPDSKLVIIDQNYLSLNNASDAKVDLENECLEAKLDIVNYKIEADQNFLQNCEDYDDYLERELED